MQEALQLGLRLALGLAVAYAAMVSVFGVSSMTPGGSLFGLCAVYVVAVVLGKAGELIALPSLVGSIVAGFALRNIPGAQVAGDIDADLAATLRGIALVIILARAGLGLDLQALLRLSGPAVRLAVIPNLVEASTAAAILASVLGWPIEWGALAGFVLSAVSPAVVVPGLLKLQEERYGTGKGIPTLVLAAASFDDVIAISGFGVCLSLAFATGDPVWAGLRGPLELIAGAAFGTVAGILCGWLAPAGSASSARTLLGSSALMAFGCVAVLGGRLADVAGGGALGVIVAGTAAQAAWSSAGPWGACKAIITCCGACSGTRERPGDGSGPHAGGDTAETAVASSEVSVELGSVRMRRLTPPKTDDGGTASQGAVESGAVESAAVPMTKAVGLQLKAVWLAVAQPLLFGLIGGAVDVTVVEGSVVGIGVAALGAGLVVRCAAAYICMLGAGFDHAEKAFVAMAWLPKATVQAAIGSVALDTAVSRGAGIEAEDRGLAVLTLAVLAIVATAPAGAVLISVFGRRWLRREGDGTSAAMVSSDADLPDGVEKGSTGVPTPAELAHTTQDPTAV